MGKGNTRPGTEGDIREESPSATAHLEGGQHLWSCVSSTQFCRHRGGLCHEMKGHPSVLASLLLTTVQGSPYLTTPTGPP